MSLESNPPRLLLVEDDPVSRSFLYEALAGLPAVVDVAEDIARAVALAAANRHALWLIDAHLPDGDGGDCLEALRLLHDVPALAITAGGPRDELDALCARGFLEVLLKPVSIALLQATVRRLLGEGVGCVREPAGGKLPIWDEARALAAIGGSRASLQALRKLFLDELPMLRQQVLEARAGDDLQSMQAVLHKLKAGCGFVGAARLAQAVASLSREPMNDAALGRFGFAADDALDGSPSQD